MFAARYDDGEDVFDPCNRVVESLSASLLPFKDKQSYTGVF